MNDNTKVPTVLIVDDDAQMLLVVSAFVRAAGFEALVAQDYESMKQIYSDDVSAVMLDLMMPLRDSEKVVEHLSREKSRVPVIFITGAFPEDIAERQMHAHELDVHVGGVLMKPFWTDDVAHSLAALNS